MNQLILSQLKLCKKAKIPSIDGTETLIKIPKGVLEVPSFVEVGGYYIVEFENYIVNPPSNFTLHDNWNGGKAPKEKVMQCVIEQVMGKMVRINGIGYDRISSQYIDGTEWRGWIPQKAISIIKRLG